VIRKILYRIGATRILLIIMGMIYLAVGFVDYTVFKNSVLTFAGIFWKILPILPLVFGLIFLSNLLIDSKKTVKYLGEQAGLKGWVISIAGGIASTGPIYMWYPLLSDLKQRGMRTSFVATFLYNRAIKIPLMPMMIFYFGWLFTAVLTVYMVIFSVINGVVVEKMERRK